MSAAAEKPYQKFSPQDWIDAGRGRHGSGAPSALWRMIWLLVVPPEGHRIVPTAAGYVLILVSLGLGSAAYNASNNILFMALSLMLSTLILSGFLSWLNFQNLKWRLLLPPHFRVDEEASLQIEVQNGKSMLPTYSLWFNTRVVDTGETKRIFLKERLEASQTVPLTWSYRPVKRGRQSLSLSGLESQFPFGFLRKTIGGGVQHEVIVLPKRIPYEFKTLNGHRMTFRGETSAKRGASSEMVNIRNYQNGDGQRLVHWKATARSRSLMVKQMAEESRDGYTLFVETPQSIWNDEAQFETLCSFVASLAEDLFREGQLLGVAINAEPVKPVRRLHDLMNFLERLAELKPIEKYQPGDGAMGYNVITFRPGNLKKIDAYVGGNWTGTA